MTEKNKISHKELLTFSNLTNLEWEFVDLSREQKTDQNGNKYYEYDPISDLLYPEVFERIVEEDGEEKRKYSYGDTGNEDYDQEEGLAQMRKEAGIAMEYLEKKDVGKKEGEFLEDWEVVYAADNYKVVSDYLDNLYSVYQAEPQFADFQLNEDGELYPSREKIESRKDLIKAVKVSFAILDGALSIVLIKGDLSNIITSQTKNKLLKKVGTELTTAQIKKVINKTDSVPLKLLSAAYLGKGSGLEAVQGITQEFGNKFKSASQKEDGLDVRQTLENNFTKEQLKRLNGELQEKTITQINQKLTMFDTGFRVVVFKNKKDNIVIAYKGKRAEDNKVLPEEIDHLQIVYHRMKRKHPDAKITFTGLDGGGDLSFLNALFSEDETENGILFYNNFTKLKGYIDFTPHDINKEYKGNMRILVEGVKGLESEVAKKILYISISTILVHGSFLAAGIYLAPMVLTAIVFEILNIGEYILKSNKFNGAYKFFKNTRVKLVEEEKIGNSDQKIKGYITDEFLDNNYIELRAGIRQRIKVKKTDALYLIYKHGGNPYIKEASNNTYNVRVDNDSGQIFENEKTLLFKLKKNKEQEYFEILREWKEGTDIPFTKQEDRVSELDDGFIPLEGIILTRVMELIAKMQRSYNKNNDKIEYIYIDHGAIDKENKSIIQFGDNILEKSKQEDKSSFFNLDIEDPDGINEFLFMPYIGEDGYIDKNNPQLRDDYIASVFKSMVQKHKEIKTHTNYKSIKQFDDGIETVKYELEEYNEKHWHDFVDPIEDVFGQQVDIEQKFVEVIKRVKCSELRKHVGHDSNYGQYKRIVYFNYYKTILQKIKEDPQILENYYEIEAASNYDQEEVLRHPRAKEATHVIKLQPNHKTKLEYKYNPEDEIIGGDLKLYVKEEETQNTLREKPAKKFKIKKDSSKSKQSMLDQREKKISASQKIEASPEFKKNKKLITNLNKKSSAKQIKKAVEVVISEAKRKRKPVIAESLEDYLSGMYTTKKVHDKKLRALDMIKTAEVELKLKMDRDLIWKLNDILYCTNKFKPYQEITFNLKKSRLVNPIGRTLEGLLNSSKKSILKAEANFVLEKVLNRKKLRLKGQLSYRWENNYRWIAGRNKHLPGYGKIDDYLFKKLADKKFARPYKMYSEWDYYLTDKISLLKDEVDSLRDWLWDDFCMFEHV